MDLKILTEKKGRFSKEEKDYLVELGARHGVEPPKEGACGECWRDMAIQLWVATHPAGKGTRLRGDAARDGVVFKDRIIVNPLDEETLAWMRDNGFPPQLLTDED